MNSMVGLEDVPRIKGQEFTFDSPDFVTKLSDNFYFFLNIFLEDSICVD